MNSDKDPVTYSAGSPALASTASGGVERALVLGGGGVRGAFQAGAVQAVIKKGFQPDAVYGTSVGALNAAFLVDRAARYGRGAIDWQAIGDELVKFWLTELDSPDKLWETRNKLSLLISVACKQFKSFWDVSRWAAIINRSLSEDNIRQSPIKLKVNAVDVDTQENFNAENCTPDLKRCIIASASIPLVMPLIKIGKSSYCDGGTRQAVLLKEAVSDGADKIVCIVCYPERGKVKPVGNLADVSELFWRISEISSSETFQDDIDLIKANSASIERNAGCVVASLERQKLSVVHVVIWPATSLDVDAMKYTHADVQNMIDAGFHQASQAVMPA